LSDIIDITERVKDKRDGPWIVLQDPVTKSVHVVPRALVSNWIEGNVEIEETHHFEAIRGILSDWYSLQFKK